MYRLLLTSVVMCLFSFTCFAQTTGGVFGPSVTEGHKSFQYRLSVDPDNAIGETGYAQRFHYQQAIDDDFMWRVVGQIRKTAESSNDFDFIGAELFWQLDQTDNYLSGVRFDTVFRDNNRPHTFGFNWMHQYAFADNWTSRFLVLTGVQFGDNAADGISLQTRASVGKNLSFGQLGVELFNNYGSTEKIPGISEQNHAIGPYFSRKVGNDGWSIYAGALFGLTDRADDTVLRFWATKKL